MDIYLLVLTICAVLIVLLFGLLTFRIMSVLSETEYLLQETRNEASPALRKLNRVLEDLETVSSQVNQQSSNVTVLLDNVREDLDDVRSDWKQVSRSWAQKLSPKDGSGSISLLARIVLEAVKAYFEFRSGSNEKSRTQSKKEDST